MLNLGSLAFATPWLLLALPLLPALWWLLRLTPPSPKVQTFPALRLLRNLAPTEETPSRTPWWMLLLRILAGALIIAGLARPIWGPGQGLGGEGPLLIVVDDGWASSGDWPARMAAAQAALETADRDGRRIALLTTAPPESNEAIRASGLMPGDAAAARLAALRPLPWAPDRAAALTALATWRQANPGPFAALYLADGVEHQASGDGFSPLANALAEGGALTLARAEGRPARLLPAPRAEADRLAVKILQTPSPAAASVGVLARTADGRALARATVEIPANATEAEATLDLPIEIRNQITRLDLEGGSSAAGVQLLDDRFRRRPVGLVAPAQQGAETPLIGPLYYLDRALSPYAEVRRGDILPLLDRQLAVMILADRPVAEGRERQALTQWVEEGGTLIRFAGPRLAESPDPLLPVPLRAGERQLGSALSWEKPQKLAPFPEGSPFAGLVPSDEVQVERQVLAEPVPRLAERSWARLTDGTPLVTAESRGAGRIVLFHVTANAEWSNLPLSGLFVEMLRRLTALSAGVQGAEGEQPMPPIETLDGFGRLGPAPAAASALPASRVATMAPSPRHPPGWYGPQGEGAERRALNLGSTLPAPRPMAAPPVGTRLAAIGGVPAERDLGPWLLALALFLLALDLIVSLRLRGLVGPAWTNFRFGRGGSNGSGMGRRGAAALLLASLLGAASAQAQNAAPAPSDGTAALAPRLAYVVTGDAGVDDVSRAGLLGLSDFVTRRTAATLAEPMAVRPGQDDLSFFPLLYWPVLSDAPALSQPAVAALNNFMRQGGIILFDTRDEGAGAGLNTGAKAALRRIARDLDIPPIAPVAEDHVLTRAFYLLPDMPGRYTGGQVWAARDQDRANDSVSPVVIGGNDWASAWAVDARGSNPYAVIPGGTRQRTLAYRFGVNLVMYALTGNYKGDQVHVPAILERLGN
ncbi:DUF4159 domain-containing protein [Acetobacteraceae bacterium H6797]|nr:DUF4159 domain-containing protein [Acetobacteraceae bacterium H6797]